ncbi:MAG: hypothetical protein WBA68_01050 [Alteraurantiacibacter sp.]
MFGTLNKKSFGPFVGPDFVFVAFALELSPLYAAERTHSSSDLTLAILAGSWATGYAIYRVRGTVL